jgi:hypothetical protein
VHREGRWFRDRRGSEGIWTGPIAGPVTTHRRNWGGAAAPLATQEIAESLDPLTDSRPPIVRLPGFGVRAGRLAAEQLADPLQDRWVAAGMPGGRRDNVEKRYVTHPSRVTPVAYPDAALDRRPGGSQPTTAEIRPCRDGKLHDPRTGR